MTGDKKQQNAGKELRQSNQPKVERLLGDLVDLPSDSDGLHFNSNYDEEPCNFVKYKVWISECDTPRKCLVRSCHPVLLCHKIASGGRRETHLRIASVGKILSE